VAIYAELSSVVFLPNSSGDLFSPKEIYFLSDTVKPYACDIRNIIDENLIFMCTGRHLLHKEFDISDDLIDLLKIPKFDVSVIISCLEKICDDAITNNESNNPQVFEETKVKLASFILAVAVMYKHFRESTNQFKSKLVDNTITQFLSQKLVSKLQSLPLWPTGNKSFISCDKSIIYISTNKSDCSDFKNIIEVFEKKMVLLSQCYCRYAKSILADGDDILLTLLWLI